MQSVPTSVPPESNPLLLAFQTASMSLGASMGVGITIPAPSNADSDGSIFRTTSE